MLLDRRPHRCVRQLLQHAIIQGRRARASTRKSEHQEQSFGIRPGRRILKAVVCAGVHPRQGRIDGIMSATGGKQGNSHKNAGGF